MTATQVFWISALCVCSAVFALLPIVLGIGKWGYRKVRGLPRSPENFGKKLLAFSALLIISIWCLRYAVGYYIIVVSDTTTLTPVEEIFNSIAHTLQTFSMDEDYTEYIFNGKAMVAAIAGADSSWITVYGLYASLLNFVAPVAGGAILFEILTSVFPRLQLGISNLAFWKDKYYFSELNERSLALAKSIREADRRLFRRPTLVFTDVYTDDESEISSELLSEATVLGAICIRDDLWHIRKNRFGTRKYFLIDEKEESNLQSLIDLSEDNNRPYLKNAEIYLFSQDDIYTTIEQQSMARIKADPSFKESELPVIIPVQSQRNLITDLLVELPLYEPLIGKKRDENGVVDLNVTIAGIGTTGMQMFLTTYWLGQMLDCRLTMNIVSGESEEDFWGRVDYINPEIRRTTVANDDILLVNRRGEYMPPYCRVNYVQADVYSADFLEKLCESENDSAILDTDYFLVSLGSDERNLAIAEKLRHCVGKHHLSLEETRRTIIAYVIYNPRLSKTLNGASLFHSAKDNDIYMRAVGSLDEVYSVKTIFGMAHDKRIEEVNTAYEALQNAKARAEAHRKRARDDYKYWATRARTMHVWYKMFMLGLVDVSVFDGDPEGREAALVAAHEQYKRLVTGNATEEDAEHKAYLMRRIHDLSWLEHRRWNAFTRVKGFRYSGDYAKYFPTEKSYKHMTLKLHPCLVEADARGFRGELDDNGSPIRETEFRVTDPAEWDLLDELSYDLKAKGINDYDFKLYDYPAFDF